VTGHQDRPGIDWGWVRAAMRRALEGFASPGLVGVSCLAEGADQVFADVVLEAGGRLVAVIPGHGYAGSLEGGALRGFARLRARAAEEEIVEGGDREGAVVAAGRRVVDLTEAMIAVWDGLPAHGAGGTADVVAYARRLGRRVVHINPLSNSVEVLS
jgi:hypothetical protein